MWDSRRYVCDFIVGVALCSIAVQHMHTAQQLPFRNI